MSLPGGWELVLVVIVIMVLFRAKRLPDASRSLGRSLRIFKAETKGLRDDDDKSAEDDLRRDDLRRDDRASYDRQLGHPSAPPAPMAPPQLAAPSLTPPAATPPITAPPVVDSTESAQPRQP